VLPRHAIVASPSTYYVNVCAALDHSVFATNTDRAYFLSLVEELRRVFDVRVFAFALTRSQLHLLVQHREKLHESDDVLRNRWARLGSRGVPTPARLRARFSSLGGFMQTLLQRFSREWNRRHASRGRLWAGRFRAALLADDRALLAAIAWIEDERHVEHSLASSRNAHGSGAEPIQLAPPPLRIGPDDFIFPADESPPSCAPPVGHDHDRWLERFAAGVSHTARAAYGRALRSGWALGRPESLASVLAKLARGDGRGRGRKLRELDDDLGLCGVWG
jgi:hypothetical protein